MQQLIINCQNQAVKQELLELYGAIKSNQIGYDLRRTLPILSRLLYDNKGNKNNELIKELIELGIDLNTTDAFGDCHLFYVATKENEEMMMLLLDSGSNVNYQSPKYEKSLLGSLISSDKDIRLIRVLLERGADHNICSKRGFRVLHSINSYKIKHIKLLVEFGADINVYSKYNQTPFDLLEKYKEKELADYLRSIGEKRYSELNIKK